MNPLKSVIAGLAIFSTAVTSAFALPSDESIIIRVTGSTAFRSQAHSAIVASFTNPPVAAYSSGSLSGAGQTFFYGEIGGQKYIITCSWAGSVGGIQTVTNGLEVNFLPDTAADAGTLAAAGAGATGGTAIGAGTNKKIPEVAMSDTYQAATPFKTPLLADQIVGVVGFKWVASRGVNVLTKSATTTAGNPVVTLDNVTGLVAGMTVKSARITLALKIGTIDSVNSTVTLVGPTASINAITAGTGDATTFVTPSPITNVNSQLAQALYSAGSAPLAQFTGNSADAATKVYAVGRDPDSGTRLSAFAETGVGVDSVVTQYKLSASNSGAATEVQRFPGNTLNGIAYATGNMGEGSGSTLAAYFGNTTATVLNTFNNTTSPAYFVGYVGSSDATTAINAGGSELTYNGVAYSDAAIKEGLYTFWCYEHVMYPSTWATAASGSTEFKKRAVIDEYANKIKLTYAPIKIAEMNCLRQSDGGNITHN